MELLAARLPMALTLGFHVILACYGAGLPVLPLFAEWRRLRTGDEGWKLLERIWGAVFAFASCAAQLFLGASAWAVASGRLPVGAGGELLGSPLTGWISPYSIFGGFFAVALCAFVSSVCLTREVAGQEMENVWRRRAIAGGVWMGALAMSGLALMASGMPDLWAGFRARAWPLVGVSVAAGLLAIFALGVRRYPLAASAVATVICGWCLAQYPSLVPPTITVERAPGSGRSAAVWTMGLGTLLVAPAFAWMLYLFKARR